MKIEKLYDHIEMAEAVTKFVYDEFVSKSKSLYHDAALLGIGANAFLRTATNKALQPTSPLTRRRG